MPDRAAATSSKARRLVTAVVNVDETLAHVDRSLSDFDHVLVEFKSLLVEFAAVLDRFNETVGRVDGTVDRVGVITIDLADVVTEMGAITQTVSPAVALNDQFRRRLDQLRSLGGVDESDPPAER
jgi:ABC-type transporter Mla subunit MlaD